MARRTRTTLATMNHRKPSTMPTNPTLLAGMAPKPTKSPVASTPVATVNHRGTSP